MYVGSVPLSPSALERTQYMKEILSIVGIWDSDKADNLCHPMACETTNSKIDTNVIFV